MPTMQFLKALSTAVVIAAAAWYSADGTGAAGGEQKPSNRSSQLNPRTRLDRCAVKATPADQLALIEQTLNASGGEGGGLVIVPVYWHIITTTQGDGA